MESVFSPNTDAFLNYLNTFPTEQPSSSASAQQTSFPPSAFFNAMSVPGRDTPDDTPSSVAEASVSPPIKRAESHDLALSDDSDRASPPSGRKVQRKASMNHKRKAGHAHVQAVDKDEEEDEDSDTDAPSGHEDKRMHGNDKDNSSKGRKGRKSTEGKEPNKAARRKEQNRAAQKAFRERREAKVKDLEEKVAELEAKHYGSSVENENLRGILKRLQEENIALKQSAFTFSMPVAGNETPSTNPSPFVIPQRQVSKPPSPPLSSTEDSLRSIHDMPGASATNKHRGSLGMVDSPESLVSIGSASASGSGSGPKESPSLSHDDAFNAFLFGTNNRPGASPVQHQQRHQSTDTSQSFGGMSSSSSFVSPPSTSQSDINALWASLYPGGVEAGIQAQSPEQQRQQDNLSQLFSNNKGFTPFTLLGSQPDFMSFSNTVDVPAPAPAPQPFQTVHTQQAQPFFATADSNPQNTQSTGAFNKFAFRDPTAAAVPPVTNPVNNWNDLTDNSMNDFLASLSGSAMNNNEVDTAPTADEDLFNAQLQQIFGGASPGSMFNLLNGAPSNAEDKGFSPNYYLNMSPSPLNSISNVQSPQSTTGSASAGSNDKSNSASPASSTSASSQAPMVSGPTSCMVPGLSTFGPPKSAHEIVHVVDETGKVVKPSDLWLKFGMTSQNVVDHLVIDDLCDQMRSKATCKDGQLQLAVKDAEAMFRHSGGKDHQERIERMKNRVTNL
ncbi:hypothetical protein IAU60_004043 [Kwoniella sp. DSM 27419]